MSHQQNSSLKKEKHINDLYCMSSTCMLLKMMEKSRNSVCPPKKIRAEGLAGKKILHNQWAGKKKHSPLPHHFSKKKSILFTSGIGQFFWATQFLPLICSLFLLRQSLCITFLALFLCAGVFRQLPTTTTPHPHHPHHPLPHPHHPHPQSIPNLKYSSYHW